MGTHGKAWMVRDKRCYPPCEPCWLAYKKHIKLSIYRRDKGLTQKQVNADKAIAMVREMAYEYGRHMYWISDVSGLDSRTLTALKFGRRKHILRVTESAVEYAYRYTIVRPPAEHSMYRHLEDSAVSVLAVRGLMAQGYTQGRIAQLIGCDTKTISGLSRAVSRHVEHQTADGLLRLVRQIGSSRGGSNYATAHAERNGWLSTMDCDELV